MNNRYSCAESDTIENQNFADIVSPNFEQIEQAIDSHHIHSGGGPCRLCNCSSFQEDFDGLCLTCRHSFRLHLNIRI